MIKEADLRKFPAELRELLITMSNTIVELREENSRLRRMLFGKKKLKRMCLEDSIYPQGSLFDEPEALLKAEGSGAAEGVNGSANSDTQPKKEKRTRPENSGGRNSFSPDLPRERVVHSLPENKMLCPTDGAELKQIGERIVETLEIVPAQVSVVQHVFPTYACPKCHNHIEQTPPPASAFPNHSCDSSLVAYLITQKYLWCLPLYRQEEILSLAGAEVSRGKMARWLITAAQYLDGLSQEIKKFILSRKIIHADETPVQVLKEPGKSPESKSYMWCLATGKHDPSAVWFEYSPSRDKHSAANLLQKFNGALHVDGYESYSETILKNNIIRIGCVAHARRKFEVANTSGSESGRGNAHWFMDRFQKLFLLEREWETLSPEERVQSREIKAKPIWDEMQKKLFVLQPQVPPKSKLGIAFGYLSLQWNFLIQYLSIGNAEISNNRMENFIRPFAVGRKNWMFSNSQDGAKASASLYSIVITAKGNGLNVEKYLHMLFEELPKLYAQSESPDLTPFLPWNWKS